MYRVQYFERNRFEYHPEYIGTPYEVLLGLLGLLGRTATAAWEQPPFRPVAAPGGSASFFPPTEHTLAPEFAAYWAAHGGLAV